MKLSIAPASDVRLSPGARAVLVMALQTYLCGADKEEVGEVRVYNHPDSSKSVPKVQESDGRLVVTGIGYVAMLDCSSRTLIKASARREERSRRPEPEPEPEVPRRSYGYTPRTPNGNNYFDRDWRY